ncbi:MAG: Holliday junction resolvase RuvX [Calditrichaeota bacterium]|nr:Holliday junction resolvase RuvX [Calditrichota bacterium]
MGKILALDIGAKRIGVAVSDELLFFAHPLKTIEWRGFNGFLTEVDELIQQHSVTELVIGVPYTLNGAISKKTKQILDLINKLRKRLNIPIIEVDESLTTKMAHDALHRVGKKPSKNRHKIDQIAAVFILQEYLDSKRK